PLYVSSCSGFKVNLRSVRRKQEEQRHSVNRDQPELPFQPREDFAILITAVEGAAHVYVNGRLYARMKLPSKSAENVTHVAINGDIVIYEVCFVCDGLSYLPEARKLIGTSRAEAGK
ncbi:unnamed protein product, partial [Cyprideis torosa]